MRNAAAIALVLTTAACQNSVAVQREIEIFPSTRYDNVECNALVQQRNALAARHGVSPTTTREPLPASNTPGFGVVIPDMRRAAERERAQAIGEISAMNRSMERREFGKQRPRLDRAKAPVHQLVRGVGKCAIECSNVRTVPGRRAQ